MRWPVYCSHNVPRPGGYFSSHGGRGIGLSKAINRLFLGMAWYQDGRPDLWRLRALKQHAISLADETGALVDSVQHWRNKHSKTRLNSPLLSKRSKQLIREGCRRLTMFQRHAWD